MQRIGMLERIKAKTAEINQMLSQVANYNAVSGDDGLLPHPLSLNQTIPALCEEVCYALHAEDCLRISCQFDGHQMATGGGRGWALSRDSEHPWKETCLQGERHRLPHRLHARG